MEKPISLTQIGLYNPRRQNSELTEKLFVIRQKQFEMLMEAIAEEEENSIPQHHIIIAQRGMGKTTMLHRMKIELQKDMYNKRFIPLAFPEEQSTVTNLGEFWLNCLDALADALEYENSDMTRVESIDNQIKEFEFQKHSEETPEKSYKFLMEVCRKIKRRPVLLIDNIGLLFNRLNKKEQHVLRSLLSENGAPIIMGAGVVVLPSQTNAKADVLKPITDYEAPFYDYFQIHYLKKLSFEEFLDLITNLSKITQNDISIINEKTPRLKTLHQLTGGNPRTAVMLFKLIVKGFSIEINDDLEALLDEITPLYKARYEELPEQLQTIVASIALNWEPISLSLLSQQTGYANNLLSPQLKRLIEDGWVETTPAEKAKGNAYSMSERFFNIWFLMRMSTRRHKQAVNLLTKFLESFYGSDLERVARKHLDKDYQCEDDFMIGMALKNSKMIDQKLKKEFDNKILSSNINIITDGDLRDEIAKIKKGNSTKDAEDFFNMGNAYYKKNNYNNAIECYEKSVELLPNLPNSYFNMGNSYYLKGNYDKAIESYQKVIELQPVASAYYNIGCVFSAKCNNDKAIEYYQKAIKLNPNKVEAYGNMGVEYYMKGNYKKAIEYFQKALDSKFNNAGDSIMENKNKYEEALELCEKTITLKIELAIKYNKLGDIFYETNNCDKAIENYVKAIESDNNSIYPKFTLQKIYRDKLSKISEAKELFNEIKDKLKKDERLLQETLFELHNRNEGIAKGFLYKALQVIKDDLPKETIDTWYYFAAIVLSLNYGNWFLDILKEKGFDKILSPYFVAVQALEFEQKEGKERAEIYLKNRAIEISDPARIIIERIKKYMD